jgi:carboxymethylenebutenolidase
MALLDYLRGEIVEDYADGLFSRRDALRRLVLLGVSLPAATALLAACAGDNGGRSTATSTATTSPASPGSASSSAVPPSSAAATPAPSSQPGTTTASPTTGAAPIPASTTATTEMPALPTEAITFSGPAGTLQGWYGAAPNPMGAVLIIHENRGLTPHFQTLPGRFAASGYSALSLDLLSGEGGTAALTDPAQATALLGAATEESLVEDMRASLSELQRRVPGAKLAIVGFCFGGGQVWSLLAAGEPRLAAAVPFYGPGPAGADFSGSNAAVLGVYAEQDSRVNATKDAMDTALTAAGLTHDLEVFPGVDHAFFNDTGPRYNAEQATLAYVLTLDWFARYLA